MGQIVHGSVVVQMILQARNSKVSKLTGKHKVILLNNIFFNELSVWFAR